MQKSIYIHFFRATPAAYGSSQAEVQSELQLPVYTTVTARPGIEPESSWIPAGLLTLSYDRNSKPRKLKRIQRNGKIFHATGLEKSIL